MNTRKLTILYWVFTILFAVLMLFSAVGGLQPSQGAIKVMHDQMGYPVYIIQFISVAKLLGVIAILVPRFNRLKEWAYAGMCFDLLGALYSGAASAGKFDPMMLMMLIWIIPGVLSYYYWHRRMELTPSMA